MISLIVSLRNLNLISALIGIASAPDFVVGEWNRLSDEQKAQIKNDGKIIINWDKYNDDYTITYKFLKDGMNNMLLNSAINIDCPIRLLHGRLDQVVSYETSEKIIEKITSKNKKLTIIEDGDHSLSRESDLQLLFDNIRRIVMNNVTLNNYLLLVFLEQFGEHHSLLLNLETKCLILLKLVFLGHS